MEPLHFNPILYNEAIYWLEQQWQRELTAHEKNVAVQIYRWCRTTLEIEELKILGVK